MIKSFLENEQKTVQGRTCSADELLAVYDDYIDEKTANTELIAIDAERMKEVTAYMQRIALETKNKDVD